MKKEEIVELFEELPYNSDMAELEKNVAEIEDIILELEAKGLEVDAESVKNYTQISKEGFIGIINQMYKCYVEKLGKVLPAEKRRIAEVYNELVDESWPLIIRLKARIDGCGSAIIEKNGKVSIDIEQAKEIIKKRHTHKYNVSKIKEYYEVVKGVSDALTRVKEWEVSNGLHNSFANDVFRYDTEETRKLRHEGLSVPMQEMNTWNFLRNINEEEFKKVTLYWFEV